MKRFSFKPVALISAMLSIPAAAQSIDDAAKLKLLAETAESGRTKIAIDTKTASLLGIKFKFEGSTLRIEASPPLPLACANQLTLEVSEKPVENWKEKLTKAESVKDDELKNFSSEIVPTLYFSGVPAVKTFPECKQLAANLEKADLEKNKISAELKNPDAPSFLMANSEIVKNAAYLKNEAIAKKVNCANCKPEDILSGLDSDERALFSTIVAKIETKVKDNEAKAKDQVVEDLEKILVEHVAAVDASTSLEDLALVRKGLKKFEADLDVAPLKDSLNPSVTKDFQLKVSAIRHQGIVGRTKAVCRDMALSSTTDAKPTNSSADTWYKVDMLLGSSNNTNSVPQSSVASTCVKFIADTEMEDVNNKGISTAMKTLFKKRSEQLTTRGSDIRLMTLGEIDERDGEVAVAKQTSLFNWQNNRQYLVSQCGANPQNPLQYNVMSRQYMSFNQMAYMQTQCDVAAKSFAVSQSRLTNLGMNITPPVVDTIGFNGFTASYNRGGAQNGQYDPFHLNPAVFQGANTQSYNNGTAYQGFNADNYYRLNQQNTNQVGTDPRAVNNTQLPYAIPLRMQTT